MSVLYLALGFGHNPAFRFFRGLVLTSSANSNLFIRLATAAVVVPLILGLLYGAHPAYFYGLTLVVTAVGSWELFRMTHPHDRVAQGLAPLVFVGVSLGVYLGGWSSPWPLALAIALPMVSLVYTLLRPLPLETAALRVTTWGFGAWYLLGPTLLALLLKENGPDGPGWVLVCLMIAWFGDTAGYFAGRFLGRHKLYPLVSPNKTVEGSLGSLGGSLLGISFAHFVYLPSLPLGPGLVLGVVAGALGQAGDLGESLLKRSTGIKDSGGILPGHGGILDRIDALLLVTPIVYAYTHFFR